MQHHYRHITELTTISDDDDACITAVGPYDILCGRDKNAFNNIGNRRFRVTISLWLSRYIGSPSRQDKTEIIHKIREVLKETGGVFLKPARGGNLVQLNDKQVREKIGHALRDMVQARRGCFLSEDMDAPRLSVVSYSDNESGLAAPKLKRRKTEAPLRQRASTWPVGNDIVVESTDEIVHAAEMVTFSSSEDELDDSCSICNSVEGGWEEHGKTTQTKKMTGQEEFSGQTFFLGCCHTRRQ